MNQYPGRPLSKKKILKLTIGLFILAWATQTLFQQWGYGQEFGKEKFVPAVPGASGGATIEVRSEATVIGSEVRLKQICRWSDADAGVMSRIGELVLARLSDRAAFRSISVQEIKGNLRDAGVNLATLNFVGATSCTVGRSDVNFDEKSALQQWLDAKDGKTEAEEPAKPAPKAAAPATAPTAPAAEPTGEVQQASAREGDDHLRTLRDVLTHDLATRLQLDPAALQITFRPQDERVLSLNEQQFKFDVKSNRARGLGSVIWEITILSEGAGNQKATIAATARAWQQQLVVARPLSFKQQLREDDVVERRTLVSELPDDPLLTRNQAVGQQAARELKAGTVLTARMVDAVPLVRQGQFVTVTLTQGNVQVKTVARSMEMGSFGQTIRVKNEATRDVYRVTITGPQTATMNAQDDATGKDSEAMVVVDPK